jgi:glucose/arabinose dehydrogenase
VGILRVLLLAAALVTPAAAEPRVSVVVSGLEVPWALAFAPDGALYVSERPGRLRVVRGGRLEPTPLATLPVAAQGEGGLMGLVLAPNFGESGRLYVCYTAARGRGLVNRVVSLVVRGGRAETERALLDDIPGASVHDGCRLKFGPDGKLYVSTGDAAEPALSQRRDSPAGKILRFNPDGSLPADNPFPGSPVYSLGHRNVQGLAWDARGRLFASEHGPSGSPGGHDEINRIQPGGNYGWPHAFGNGDDPQRFLDPVLHSGQGTWAPSGIAILGDHLYVAALRGQRLLRMRITAEGGVADFTAWLAGTHGRLRDVVVGPDGALYVTTSNRDGRGSPRADDDRILRLVP